MSFPREEPRQNHPPHIISSSSRGASPSESSSYSGNTFNDGNNSNDASISRPNFYDLTSTSYEDDYSLGNKSNNSRSSRNCSVMDDGSNFRAGFKEPSTGMQTMPLKSARNHRPIFELNEESTTTNNERNVINLLDDGSECSSGEDEMKRKRPLENDISSCGTTKIISQKLDIDSEQKKTRNLNESRKPEAGENSISTDVAKRGSRQSSAASFNVNCKQNSFHDESLSSHKPNNPYNRSTKTTATIPQQISTSCSGHPSSQSRTSSKPYNPYMKSTKSSAVFAQKSSRSNSVTPVTDERNSILLSQSNISSGPQQKTMDGAVVTFGLLALIEELRDENTFTCTRNSLPTKNAINESSSFPHQQLQHFSQNDNWSCGFRNLQMMLCSLIPKFHDIFPNGIPSLRELQTSLELLWTEGFDPDGAKHHKFKMVGKRTWIGTVEVWSYLVFRGIDATIVQFVKTQESRAALGKFVWAYFAKLIESDGCPFGGCGNRGGRNSGDLVSSQSMKSMQYVNQLLRIVKSSLGVRTRSDLSCKCPLPPLYLQWSGHSVTVVGIRKLSEDQYNLIVFDPMKKGPFIKTKLLAQVNGEVMNAPNPLSAVELPDHILRNKDCQILLCTGQLINDVDREKCKSTISCVTALKKVNVVG